MMRSLFVITALLSSSLTFAAVPPEVPAFRTIQIFSPVWSSIGNPYDNAALESFMKTLKYEEVYLGDYETYEDVVERLPRFIEAVYNKKRLHSSLGYMSPDDFEKNGGRK